MNTDTEWVAVDWGTSNVRAWGIAADGSHTFAVGSDKGMGKLARGDFPYSTGQVVMVDGGLTLARL